MDVFAETIIGQKFRRIRILGWFRPENRPVVLAGADDDRAISKLGEDGRFWPDDAEQGGSGEFSQDGVESIGFSDEGFADNTEKIEHRLSVRKRID